MTRSGQALAYLRDLRKCVLKRLGLRSNLEPLSIFSRSMSVCTSLKSMASQSDLMAQSMISPAKFLPLYILGESPIALFLCHSCKVERNLRKKGLWI
jgi:hypothetical protein